jgi:hypothetical protein
MTHFNFTNFKYAPASAVQLADKLLQLKKTQNPWEVIKFVVKSWAGSNPKTWRSHIVHVKGIKDSRKVTRVGTKEFTGVSKDKVTGAYLRYTLDIPEKVIYIIRKLYTPEELPMDKKFYYKFGRLFPAFRISERK